MTKDTPGVVVCVESFWSESGVVRRGERVASDDPRVQRAPQWFIADDGLDDRSLGPAIGRARARLGLDER